MLSTDSDILLALVSSKLFSKPVSFPMPAQLAVLLEIGIWGSISNCEADI